MEESVSPEENPWSCLPTLTTFDEGNDKWTTRCMDEDPDVQTNGQVLGRVSPSTSLLIESLIQQLCTMFEGDSVQRNKLYYAICDRLHEMKLINSSYNMTEFEMVRGQYQRALYHLVTVARASTGSESVLQVPSCLMAEWSRYRQEFQEIGFIARGGFGNVFKARHYLDGIEYAIKKIVVRCGRVKTIMQHLAEVRMLAKLNHANIVSYKAAWIEPMLPTTIVPSLPSTDRRKTKVHISERTSKTKSHRSHRNGSIKVSQQSDLIWRNASYTASQSSTSEQAHERNEIDKSISHDIESCKSTMHIDIHTNLMKNGLRRESGGGYTVSDDIFGERFHELNSTTNIIGRRISERNDSEKFETSYSSVVSFRNDPENSRNDPENSRYNNDQNHSNKSQTDEVNSAEDSEESVLFEESVQDRRICQYNSPMNNRFATLYIQMALCEKTLREWLDERVEETPQPLITAILTQILCGLEYIHSHGIIHHDIKPSNIFISLKGQLQVQLGDFGLACPLQREDHHSVLGTHMYAAPEQLSGKCNPKSDVYSLGIILLELLVPMQTTMERYRMIEALKAGQIPTSLTVNHPSWAYVMSQMVQRDPNARPSTKQLLQDLSEDKDMAIAKLKFDNDKKSTIIQELQNKIAQQESEIARLKCLISDT